MRASSWLGVSMMVWACSPPQSVPPPPPAPPPVSARHFTLECPRRAVGAYDATRGLIPDRPLRCLVHVGDRSGAPLEGATVSFLTEAGRVRSEGQSSAAGIVDAEHETALPLPVDVEPETYRVNPIVDATHTGVPLAPAWMLPLRWVEAPTLLVGGSGTPNYTLAEPRRPDPLRFGPAGPLQNNPRDNLVTLVAVTSGDEGFTDVNANGTWDSGEAFDDLTEPFVDVNDNGTHDPGEAFVDVDENGQWDGKNGRWDQGTRIWVQERVLWTGSPAAEDFAPVLQGITGHRPTALLRNTSLLCPGIPGDFGKPCVQALSPQGGSVALALGYLADPWFNTLARDSDEEPCVLEPDPGPFRVQFGPPDSSLESGTYPAGSFLSVAVSDLRDPADPQTQVLSRPPLRVTRVVACSYVPAEGVAPVVVELELAVISN